MDKVKASFADDLRTIQGEVEADVGTILQLAKHQQSAAGTGPRENEERAFRKGSDRQSTTRPRSRRAPASPNEQAANFLETAEPLSLCNVTTRLSCRTNELLTEAALRQRLSKAVPATRQDIIEQALCEWLQCRGYDRPR